MRRHCRPAFTISIDYVRKRGTMMIAAVVIVVILTLTGASHFGASPPETRKTVIAEAIPLFVEDNRH
jgi:hypothetical protein